MKRGEKYINSQTVLRRLSNNGSVESAFQSSELNQIPKSKSPLEFLAAAPALECEVESRKDGKLRVNKCNDQSALMDSESDCDRKRKK